MQETVTVEEDKTASVSCFCVTCITYQQSNMCSYLFLTTCRESSCKLIRDRIMVMKVKVYVPNSNDTQ